MVTIGFADVAKVSVLDLVVDSIPDVDVPVVVAVPVSVTPPPPPVEPTKVAVIVECVLATAPCTLSQNPYAPSPYSPTILPEQNSSMHCSTPSPSVYPLCVRVLQKQVMSERSGHELNGNWDSRKYSAQEKAQRGTLVDNMRLLVLVLVLVVVGVVV